MRTAGSGQPRLFPFGARDYQFGALHEQNWGLRYNSSWGDFQLQDDPGG
jgi:hypothetical protein